MCIDVYVERILGDLFLTDASIFQDQVISILIGKWFRRTDKQKDKATDRDTETQRDRGTER